MNYDLPSISFDAKSVPNVAFLNIFLFILNYIGCAEICQTTRNLKKAPRFPGGRSRLLITLEE